MQWRRVFILWVSRQCGIRGKQKEPLGHYKHCIIAAQVGVERLLNALMRFFNASVTPITVRMDAQQYMLADANEIGFSYTVIGGIELQDRAWPAKGDTWRFA